MLNSQADLVSHTHHSADKLNKEQISQELIAIKSRLNWQFAAEPQKMQSLLAALESLTEFELGRFLIKNKGALSGYWTWYVILGFNVNEITSPLEKFILEKSPAILATRERFKIFQTLLTKHIIANSIVCSAPCGMMADLLTLQLSASIHNVKFVGIDLDYSVFALAKNLQQQTKNRFDCEYLTKDAWHLDEVNVYDVITTNGLNIYEKDDDKVVALYRTFYRALKNNGKLICSALTLPPGGTHPSEWNLNAINQQDMMTHATLFKVILEATWANFRSSRQTIAQLKAAGFVDVEVYWDTRKIFPSFCASKN